MASSNDDNEGDDSGSKDVDLYGRLRNPGPNTTEIESHEEADEVVDEVGERLRPEVTEDESAGPSLDARSEPTEVADEEDLEDSLLDALDTESEDASEPSDSDVDTGDTDAGLANAAVSDTGAETLGESSESNITGDTGSAPADAPPVEQQDGATAQDERESLEAQDGRKAPEAEQEPEPLEVEDVSEPLEIEDERGSPDVEDEHDFSAEKVDEGPDTDQAGQICSECNSISPTGMRFCVQCGAALDDESVEQKQEEAPDLDEARLDESVPSGLALIEINDDGTDGKRIPIESSKTIVGRDGDTRFPTDEFLDPAHTRLTVEDGNLHVEDLNTLNGTYLKVRDKVPLEPGDMFLMGRQVLRFERIDQDLDSERTDEAGTRYMGSPAPSGDYKILQIGVGELVQNIYCLPDSGVVLGREKGDIIFPRDKFMSGRHARIFTDDQPQLVDLDSSNGTWIKILEKQRLEKEDFIFMGQQLFRVELPN